MFNAYLHDVRDRAFDVIQRDFPCERYLLNKIFLDKITEYYADSLFPSSKPFFIRITGQSGSGKSSQLLPAVQNALKDRKYMHLTIGKFAIFHPEYEEFQKKTPDMAREKTNGFALRAMLLFFEYCVKKRVNIILDFSLLDTEFEIYLLTMLKSQQYKIHMHVMCVPQEVSNTLIARRWKETHRCVTQQTASYTFDMLPHSLEQVLEFKDFSEDDKIVLWSLCSTSPVICTNFFDKSVLNLLQKYRAPEYNNLVEPSELLLSKTIWMKDFLKDF